MTADARSSYFLLWADVCAAQGWNPRDNDRRRETTRYCMREIGAGDIDSITVLDEHQITALFTLLRSLADSNATNRALWETCKEDYVAFNQLRQAEHFRHAAGYGRKGRLNRDRFGVNFDEQITEHTMTPDEVRAYLITNANRARAKGRLPRRKHPSSQPSASHLPAAAACPF